MADRRLLVDDACMICLGDGEIDCEECETAEGGDPDCLGCGGEGRVACYGCD